MASRGNTWTVPAGESASFTVTICGPTGAPITGVYDGTEPLTAICWEGSGLAPIAGVVNAQWLSATAGTVAVVVIPPSEMTPGYYRVRLSVTFAGATSQFYNGWLQVQAIPGVAVELPTYCTFQQCMDLAGDWLIRLMQSSAGDETNFAQERAMAREWLDDIIVGLSRVFAYRFDLNYALVYGSFPFGPVESPDMVIAGYLASNYLVVKPRTIECNVYKALAFICEKRVTFDDKGEEYKVRAGWYHRKASNSLRRYRAELDVNQDGHTDIAFNCGLTSLR